MSNGITALIRKIFHQEVALPDHWANIADLEAMHLTTTEPNTIGGCVVGGIRVGNKIRPLIDQSDSHVLIVAPARTGKGVGLMIPTLLRWSASAVVLDIAGECFETTATWRRSGANNRTIKFHPRAQDGSSARFNPLEEIRLTGDRAIQDAQEIAMALIMPDEIPDSWRERAANILQAAILHVMHIESDKTLSGVWSFLNEGDPNKLFLTLSRASHPHADHVGMIVRQLDDLSENGLSSILSIINLSLTCFRDPEIQAATQHSNFALSELMDADIPTTLYFIMLPYDKDRIAPLFRIMLAQTLSRSTESFAHKNKLLLMLDEFTLFGRLEFLQKALSYLPSYGIKGYFTAQTIEAIAGTYGPEDTFVKKCKIRIAFAQRSPESAEFIARWAGAQGATQDINDGQLRVPGPALLPQEIMQLSSIRISDGQARGGDMLIFNGREKPIKGESLLYFSDPVYRDRATMPAEKLSAASAN